MFVLDKEIIGGHMSTVWSYENDTYVEVKDKNEYIPMSGGGNSYFIPLHSQISSYKFKSSISSLTFHEGEPPENPSGDVMFPPPKGAYSIKWVRLSDGTLVQRNLVGMPVGVHGAYDYESSWVSTRDAPFESHATALNDTTSLFKWYTTGSIAGGAYKICVLDVGATTEEFQSSSYKKYMVDVGSAGEWWFDNDIDEDLPDFRVDESAMSCGAASESLAWRNMYSSYSRRTNHPFRLMAIPTSAAPVLTPESQNLGTITEPTTISFQVGVDGASVTVSIDGEYKLSATSTGGTYSLDLTPYWGDLSLAAHRVDLIVTANGYKCGGYATFTKSSSMIQVTGKPVETAGMATMCIMKDTATVPSGATILREVTNNAMDQNPTWETYAGDRHSFANDSKSADGWGINWRVTIDNSAGTSQARLSTGVGMGFLTKRVSE